MTLPPGWIFLDHIGCERRSLHLQLVNLAAWEGNRGCDGFDRWSGVNVCSANVDWTDFHTCSKLNTYLCRLPREAVRTRHIAVKT